MYRYRAVVLGVVAIFALAACEDSTGPEGGLSEEEASALSSAIVGQSLQVGLEAFSSGQSSAASVTAARAPTPFNVETSVTAPCPEGGTVTADVAIDGTVDSESNEVDLTFQLTATHSGCGVVHEQSGREFTLTTVEGDELTLNMDLVIDASRQLTATGDYSGTVEWATEGREGRCSVSATFEMSGDVEAGTFTGTIDGTACGVSFSRTTSVG